VGLGLPIARRLVEAQGGRISIESADGNAGTAVVLMLPTAPVEGEQLKQAVAAEASTYVASGFGRTLE
jgi:K+-sensing histidine kinase KdpD